MMHAHTRPRPNTIAELIEQRRSFGREVQSTDLYRRQAIEELNAWRQRCDTAAQKLRIALPPRDRVLVVDGLPSPNADRLVVRRLDTADDERRGARPCYSFDFYRSTTP